MSEGTGISYDAVVAWLKAFTATIAENKAYLTELDSAIGDADHGINMDRGFQAVLAARLVPARRRRRPLQGRRHDPRLDRRRRRRPLYGTLFLQLGIATAGKDPITADDWAAALAAAVSGVQARGKAEPGDKMVGRRADPGRDAFAAAIAEGGPARGAPSLGRCRRAGHDRHDPARRPQGTGQLPR